MDVKNLNSHNYRTSYLDGNTARKLNASEEIRREHEQYEVPSNRGQEKKVPKTLQGMNLVSLLVMVAAVLATVSICVEYLKLQTDVLQNNKTITSMGLKLETMKSENDAAYDQINKTYDLAYVYKVAVKELGMVFPNKNKVIKYKKSIVDYVRQYEDIPN